MNYTWQYLDDVSVEYFHSNENIFNIAVDKPNGVISIRRQGSVCKDFINIDSLTSIGVSSNGCMLSLRCFISSRVWRRVEQFESFITIDSHHSLCFGSIFPRYLLTRNSVHVEYIEKEDKMSSLRVIFREQLDKGPVFVSISDDVIAIFHEKTLCGFHIDVASDFT